LADSWIDTADASDHEGAAKSIAEGIRSGHSKEHPGYYLHTGGTGILTYVDDDNNSLGEWSEKEYNDWTGVEEITNLPDHAFHRNVDKVVLEAGTKYADAVKTTIVCPPTIYGKPTLTQLLSLSMQELLTPLCQATAVAQSTNAAAKSTNSPNSY
jgi:hypothetical protein